MTDGREAESAGLRAECADGGARGDGALRPVIHGPHALQSEARSVRRAAADAEVDRRMGDEAGHQTHSHARHCTPLRWQRKQIRLASPPASPIGTATTQLGECRVPARGVGEGQGGRGTIAADAKGRVPRQAEVCVTRLRAAARSPASMGQMTDPVGPWITSRSLSAPWERTASSTTPRTSPSPAPQYRQRVRATSCTFIHSSWAGVPCRRTGPRGVGSSPWIASRIGVVPGGRHCRAPAQKRIRHEGAGEDERGEGSEDARAQPRWLLPRCRERVGDQPRVAERELRVLLGDAPPLEQGAHVERVLGDRAVQADRAAGRLELGNRTRRIER